MQSPTSQPGESLDSTAKVMQEALNKASAELDKTVAILMGQLALFNQSLEKRFQTEVKAIDERLEACLKQNLDLMSRDKDELTKQLAEHRHAEVQALIQSGREVRAKLQAQVSEATEALNATVAARLEGLRAELSKPSVAQETAQSLRGALTREYEDAVLQMSDATRRGEDFINSSGKGFSKKLTDAMTVARAPVASYIEIEKSRLTAESIRLVAGLNEKHENLLKELDNSEVEAIAEVQQGCSQASRELANLSGSTSQFIDPLTDAFEQSLQGVAAVMYGQYEKQLRNLLAQSRTEILSTAQQAEEKVAVTRNEVQMTLKSYQREYVEAVTGLLSKLEKTLEVEARESGQAQSREVREGKIREQLSAVFRRLGHAILDSASQAATQLETDFQQSMEVFEKRIDSAKDTASESLERETKQMQKELNRSCQDFEKQMAELEFQLTRLEKAGRDAADIVLTISQANLNLD